MISFVRTYLSWPILATPATWRLAPAGLKRTLPVRAQPQRVGWRERLVRRSSMSDCVRRSSQSEGGSDTHQLHLMVMMGFAGLNPSYVLESLLELRSFRLCENRLK